MGAAEEKALQELLGNKSGRDVRAICIQGLRRWRERTGGRTNAVTMHGDLGLNTLEVLEKTGTKVNAGAVKEVFLQRQQIDPRGTPKTGQ